MFCKFVVLGGMLLGLPLLGVYLAGYPLNRYLEFPPKTQYIEQAPFSWPAFAVLSVIVLAVVLPLAHQGIQANKKTPQKAIELTPKAFPRWGWIGVIIGSLAWILAWNRFSWFIAYQPHTFSPLWFSYIVVVNALCVRQTGHSLMTDRPGFFLLLFPVSAVFWWFFEYPEPFCSKLVLYRSRVQSLGLFLVCNLALYDRAARCVEYQTMVAFPANWIKLAYG